MAPASSSTTSGSARRRHALGRSFLYAGPAFCLLLVLVLASFPAAARATATATATVVATVVATEVTLPANAVAANQAALIRSVACPPAGACMAVGNYLDTNGQTQAMIVLNNVATEVTLPANASTTTPSAELSSVACPVIGPCIAIGFYEDSTGALQAMTVAGGVATEVALPAGVTAIGGGSLLATSPKLAIACPPSGSNPCTAVTNYGDWITGVDGLLVIVNDVATALPLPAGGTAGFLDAIACPASGSCTAVGGYTESAVGAQLLTVTNGVATGIVVPGAISASLDAVACPPSGPCLAVGGDLSGSSGGQWVTEANGVVTGVTIPNGSSVFYQGMAAVACPAIGPCVGVGGSGYALTVLNNIATVVNPPANLFPYILDDRLSSVACPASGPCIAVGYYLDSAESNQAMEVINGVATEIQLPANTSTIPGVLKPPSPFIACTPSGSCLMAGGYADGAGNTEAMTAALSNGATTPPPSPTPAPVPVKPAPVKPVPVGVPRLTHLRLAPVAFYPPKSGPSQQTASRFKPGTIISYSDSQVATATFTVFRRTHGQRKGKVCKQIRSGSHLGHGVKSCVLYLAVGGFARKDTIGSNSLLFTGRVGGKTLPRGSYQLRITPRDASGHGSTVTRDFRIL